MIKIKNKILLKSALAAIIAIAIDFVFHLLFTHPMETLPYFFIKLFFAFLFAIVYFSFFKYSIKSALIAGSLFSLAFGIYYNILPLVGIYPLGLSVKYLRLNFSNSLLLTGIIFGIVHSMAFFTGLFTVKKTK